MENRESGQNPQFKFEKHPRYLENTLFNELEKEFFEMFQKNLRAELMNKPVREKFNILKLYAEQYSVGENHVLVNVGRQIRLNENRFVTRVQDLRPVYEKFETTCNSQNVSIVFDQMLFVIVQAIMEQDYIGWLHEQMAALDPNAYDLYLSPTKCSNRVKALSYKFKAEAGLEAPRTKQEWIDADHGNLSLYNTFLHITSKRNLKYRKVTSEEVLKVIEVLRPFPEAAELARKAYREMLSSK